MLVISPYAKPNLVAHRVYNLTSTLKFMEVRWGLGHLAARDHRANDMVDYFDFDQAPNPKLAIPIPGDDVLHLRRPSCVNAPLVSIPTMLQTEFLALKTGPEEVKAGY